MKKLLNSINPEKNAVGNILFFALITFFVCFALFQSMGKRPEWLFRIVHGNIIELNDNAFLTTHPPKGISYTSHLMFFKIDNFNEVFYNSNREYAKLFDINKPVKVWYYRGLFERYYTFSQVEQDGKLLLETHNVSGVIYLALMIVSFIVSGCCVYIRRDFKA